MAPPAGLEPAWMEMVDYITTLTLDIIVRKNRVVTGLIFLIA
jgi:hypothetical protein